MAKSFDELVKRTTTKKTQAKAAWRAQELLGELLLSEVRELTGKSQQQVAKTLGMKQPSLSKLEKQADICRYRRCGRSSQPWGASYSYWRNFQRES